MPAPSETPPPPPHWGGNGEAKPDEASGREWSYYGCPPLAEVGQMLLQNAWAIQSILLYLLAKDNGAWQLAPRQGFAWGSPALSASLRKPQATFPLLAPMSCPYVAL